MVLGKGWPALPTLGIDFPPVVDSGRIRASFFGGNMSIIAMTWVFKQPLRPSWLKFLLLALADNANDEGHCYPSGKYLCIKTSLNRKTVISGLDQLEAKGYLIDTGQRKGATKQVKVYQIRVPEEGLLNSPVEGTLVPERVPSVPPKSPVCTTKESRARDTESSRNRQEPLREDLSTRLKAMIASFEKVGNKAKAAKYRAELELLEATRD
jgi:biotin operon repressor